ncbi:sigma-54-dependent transcriptional regulator [Halanaerobium hydrogeniformans]|uniref:Stage 0 sporulation protein A homolog n=1 Tax=Halanaerobium hydrogeniformans TaxID=656519 RepID=E4RKM1_HALHG|nr:sigma-54 dependent transcriptional regulator [Halanaerobium hydrogeniformans]ADQ15668.1 two component, sigma54 specific, transcriptional regulator, Fis family [Halanaerobium hydrogeniformans]
MAKILIVDDKENITKVLKVILEEENYQVEYANDVYQAIEKAILYKPDLIISDIKMPEMDGLEFYREIINNGIKSEFIFMTAFGSIPMAVKAIKMGASEFLTKPLDYNELKIKIANLIGKSDTKNLTIKREKYREIIGQSDKINKLIEMIDMAADYSSTVLIQGESGTGKELVAKALHNNGSRADKNFVAVNCAALSPNIIESELFGHKEGAFTGAVRDKKGKFEIADGGSILLDEVTEIDLNTQSKLLRVLQEKEFERVGENKSIQVDLRVIATTNRDIKKMVDENKFRSDLYYRLNVIPIHVPPLRERKEDIKILTKHFIDKISRREGINKMSISNKALKLLQQYNWPGNIRELENLCERLVITVKGEKITVMDIPQEIKNSINQQFKEVLTEKEKVLIALRKSSGNKTKAAEILGISRKTIYNWIKKYENDPEFKKLLE